MTKRIRFKNFVSHGTKGQLIEYSMDGLNEDPLRILKQMLDAPSNLKVVSLKEGITIWFHYLTDLMENEGGRVAGSKCCIVTTLAEDFGMRIVPQEGEIEFID